MSAAAVRAGQLRLALDHTPSILVEHGLREAHSRPLVSDGKQAATWASRRVAPSEAWGWAEVEWLRTGNKWTALGFDLDGDRALDLLLERVWYELDTLPVPNLVVQRKAGGGLHAAYTLAEPVHRLADARVKPLRLLRRVVEYLAERLEADRGYAQVLAHNPEHNAFRTIGFRREPYELGELAAGVPLDWRAPARGQTRTAVGRNCALFDALIRWAGREVNAETDPLETALKLNAEFVVPLPRAEVGYIVKSVRKYRERWVAQNVGGWHRPTFIERQSARGRRSVIARRDSSASRNLRIWELSRQGLSLRQIAAHVGVSHETVRQTIRAQNQPKTCVG